MPRQISRCTITSPRCQATRGRYRGTLHRAMARPEISSAPGLSAEPGSRPELSVVVTLFEEQATLDELHARLTAALEGFGRTYEVLYVDDGSTDGTFASLQRHPRRRRAGARGAAEAKLRPASRDARGTLAGSRGDRRDDGRRPAEPARGRAAARRGRRGGLRRRERTTRRAPRLVGAHRAVADDQRHAAPLHGRRHLRLRLRVQRVPARGGRADARRDRAAEVHEGARPLGRRLGRRGRRRARAPRRRLALLAAATHATRAARPRRLLAAADPDRRDPARDALLARLARTRRLRARLLGLERRLPRPAPPRRARRRRPRRPGLHPRARRRAPRQNPARRESHSSTGLCVPRRHGSSDRAVATLDARRRRASRHRRRRVHPVEPHPAPARAHAARGDLARRADLRGEPREPRRRDEPRAARVRPRRHPRRGPRARARRRRRRDRQRRRRVARREVDPARAPRSS